MGNGYGRALSARQIAELRRRREKGWEVAALATAYGVHRRTVHRYLQHEDPDQHTTRLVRLGVERWMLEHAPDLSRFALEELIASVIRATRGDVDSWGPGTRGVSFDRPPVIEGPGPIQEGPAIILPAAPARPASPVPPLHYPAPGGQQASLRHPFFRNTTRSG